MDLTLIPAKQLLALRESVRTETERRGLSGEVFDQADRLVARGHVCISDRLGWVFDGEWRNVSRSYCPFCGHGAGPCAHQIAVVLATALNEACPQREQAAAIDGAGYSGGGIGRSGRRSSGGYSGGRRAGGGKRGTCRDCAHCRWHTDSGCNNPNRKAGRNWRA